MWYRVGYILELPSEHKGNFTNHIGVMFQSSAVRFEWRVSFGFLGQRTRHDFGARLGDRNPYRQLPVRKMVSGSRFICATALILRSTGVPARRVLSDARLRPAHRVAGSPAASFPFSLLLARRRKGAVTGSWGVLEAVWRSWRTTVRLPSLPLVAIPWIQSPGPSLNFSEWSPTSKPRRWPGIPATRARRT